MNPVEINFIKQDIRELQKKLDAILKRLDQVEANTNPSVPGSIPVEESIVPDDDCACRGKGPCQCE